MTNETNIKVSKRNQKIVESIRYGVAYRYVVKFIDGIERGSSRKSDIDYWIKEAGRYEFDEIINGTRYVN